MFRSKKPDVNRFTEVMRAVRGQIPSLFAFSFLVNALLLTTPLYMLQIFDRVLSSGSSDTLIWLSVIALGALAVYGLLEQVRKRLLTRIGAWVDRELAPDVIKNAIRSRLSNHPQEANFEDVSDVRSYLGSDAILAFLDAPWIPLFIFVIWLLHPFLGMIAIAGAILLFLIALLNDRLTRSRQGEVNSKARSSGNAASHFIETGDTISPLGMTDAIIGKWIQRRAPVIDKGVTLTDINTRLSNLSRFLRLGLQVAVLGAGAALIIQAELTPGGMIAASIIMSRALSPVERSISAWRSFVSYRKAKLRLTQLFDVQPEEDDSFELPKPTGLLTAEGVRYMPYGATIPVLKKVDFRIEPGEVCGLIGPSGSGKSTLCKVIVGSWKPDFGNLRLDGADTATWNPEHLGPHIGYLSQEVELFAGTIAENIARMGDVDPEKVVSAAKLAGAHETILQLPEGYQTEVGPRGAYISGGQKQRVALARALFGDPILLVLDEPNSNLDGDGELALFRALVEMKKRGSTIVIVAHQPSLLRVADKVLILKSGLVDRFGPRDKVLKSLVKTSRVSSPKDVPERQETPDADAPLDRSSEG